MKLKVRIALSVYVAFAIIGFVEFCFSLWGSWGHAGGAGNWIALLRALLFGAGNAIAPTVLVMLGVFSNTWFPRGLFSRGKTPEGLK